MRPVPTDIVHSVVGVSAVLCVCWAHQWVLLNSWTQQDAVLCRRRLTWAQGTIWMHIGTSWKIRLNDRCIAMVLPSVLWSCWLGGRKGIRPVKNWVVGCWYGYLSGTRCRLAYGPADVSATHCLLLSCFSKIQIGFTFLVLAHLGSPGQRAIKRVCVCVCACVRACVCVHSNGVACVRLL